MKKTSYLFLIAVIAALINGCKGKEEQPGNKPEENHKSRVMLKKESIAEVKLETIKAELKPITGFISLAAKVLPSQDNEAMIGSMIEGRVKKVFVKAGDYVSAGQVLMTIEGLDIGVLKADYLKTQAQLNYAKANLERQQKLFDEKIGSKKSLLEMQAEYEKALAEFNAEDKKIHSIGLSDEDIINQNSKSDHISETLPIRAPISGMVIERNVVLGQHVEPQTNAFRILNTSTVYVDGQIYEKDLPKIQPHSSVEFITGTFPDKSFTGELKFIGQLIDERTRTITVRAIFDNKNGSLKPQMFGDMRISVGKDAKGLIIPAKSVLKEDGAEYVFVQSADTVFDLRMIKASQVNETEYVITEGLNSGERIVTEGTFYLKSELKKAEFGEE